MLEKLSEAGNISYELRSPWSYILPLTWVHVLLGHLTSRFATNTG